MTKFSKLVLSGALATPLLLATVVSTSWAAEEEPGWPEYCYLNSPHCSDLDGDGYWSGCNDPYEGVIDSFTASVICTKRHPTG